LAGFVPDPLGLRAAALAVHLLHRAVREQGVRLRPAAPFRAFDDVHPHAHHHPEALLELLAGPVGGAQHGGDDPELDVTVSPSSEPKDYPEDCPDPCVPGWRVSGPATAFDFLAGSKVRIAVLEVGGEPVLVTAEAAEADEDEFEGFLPEAQQVLDTVEWASR
jgi:hypothetical protein